MAGETYGVHDYARIALGLVRLANGLAALVAPLWLLRRLGADPSKNRATAYVFRMFGIRTVLIGLELLRGESEERERSVQRAPLIHASDTTAAAIAGLRGHLPPQAAVKAVLISAGNTALALLARSRRS